MTIPAAAKSSPIDLPNANVRPVEPRTGAWTMEELQRQQRLRDYVVGSGRIIPCSCVTDSNVLTLTPNGHGTQDGVAPLIEGYRFGDVYMFIADASTTGAVTATVVPKKGALATLKVYKASGATQAGNTDITAGNLYMAAYAYNLDSNAGGLVIRHP